MSKKYLFAYTN